MQYFPEGNVQSRAKSLFEKDREQQVERANAMIISFSFFFIKIRRLIHDT